ncbi:MAG: hypothetical protein SFU86_00260 [Pirellulaceae bacterium]|nr:hypothetical protein [Pirellulaceae bacterium]
MPIKVACACGAAFAAKDELAGRTVKCPKCQQPLKIPAAGGSPVATTRTAAPQAPKQRASAPPAPAADHSAFDDVGLGQRAAGTQSCPGCGASMPPNAILCIKCGYNAKLGRRMATIGSTSTSAAGGHDGHGAASAEILNRAAQTLAEDAEEDKKKTGEGAPWWVYLLGLGGVIGFIAMMMLLPPRVALMTGGVVFYIVAVCVNIYSSVRILIIAFTEGIGHGIGCLLCGFYGLYYCITRWEQCGAYFLMGLAANVVGNILGVAFTALASQFNESEQGQVPIVAPAEATWHCPALLRAAEPLAATNFTNAASGDSAWHGAWPRPDSRI